MTLTACIKVVSGLTATSGVRAILSRPIKSSGRWCSGWGNSSASRAGLHYDLNMVLIPRGWFWMGSESHYKWESPRHRVWVDAFEIGRTLVTRREYEAFLELTGYAEPT